MARVPAELLPGKRGGPKIKARAAARIRGRAAREGRLTTAPTATLPDWSVWWDKVKRPTLPKPPKGKKYLQTREQRVEKILAALETADAEIAAYNEARKIARRITPMEKQLLADKIISKDEVGKYVDHEAHYARLEQRKAQKARLKI